MPLVQTLVRVDRPDPEVNFSHRCIELEFNPDIVGEEGYDGWLWRKSVVQADSGIVYVMADSKESFELWENTFKEFLM